MSTEKMREEFEMAFRSRGMLNAMSCGALNSMLERGSDGEYRSIRVHGAWWGWQASRAAIEVELPEAFCAYGGQGHHGSDPDDAYIVEDVVRAIESLGLRVKP